jgi:Cu-Zn family superoxide dismutase
MKKILTVTGLTVVLGACSMMQEPTGPSANVQLRPASGSKVQGNLTLTQIGADRVRISGDISGHTPGPKGFHIHEKGDCSAPDAMSAGGHFNPMKRAHGPTTLAGHSGDMGNLTFDQNGNAKVNMIVEGVSVSRGATNGVLGRAIVVHMSPDDLKTDPTGNAGARAACGVIG